MFERGLALDVPILCDPERVAYDRFGFGKRLGWHALLHPRYWWRLIVALARGRRLRRVREDPHQLGGDVIVDAHGICRWVYSSRWPADRPRIAELRRQLTSLPR